MADVRMTLSFHPIQMGPTVWAISQRLPDGSQFTAVGNSYDDLVDRVRESARAEGWSSYVIYKPNSVVNRG